MEESSSLALRGAGLARSLFPLANHRFPYKPCTLNRPLPCGNHFFPLFPWNIGNVIVEVVRIVWLRIFPLYVKEMMKLNMKHSRE